MATTTIDGWTKIIAASWQKAVQNIIQTGKLLLDAKEGKNKLEHGDFETMVQEKLPFGPRAAQMLMEIARNKVLRNPNHGSLLPASWRTLYVLSRLDDAVLEAKIADGTIKADMERDEAEDLKDETEAVAEGRPVPESRKAKKAKAKKAGAIDDADGTTTKKASQSVDQEAVVNPDEAKATEFRDWLRTTPRARAAAVIYSAFPDRDVARMLANHIIDLCEAADDAEDTTTRATVEPVATHPPHQGQPSQEGMDQHYGPTEQH